MDNQGRTNRVGEGESLKKSAVPPSDLVDAGKPAKVCAVGVVQIEALPRCATGHGHAFAGAVDRAVPVQS